MPPTPGNFEFLLRDFGVAMDDPRIVSISGPGRESGASAALVSGIGGSHMLASGASAVPILGVKAFIFYLRCPPVGAATRIGQRSGPFLRVRP